MFKTIKSKILIIALAMMSVLILAIICYVGIFRMKTKQLMLQNYAYSVNTFVQQINEKVIKAEDNSNDLALLGKLFYKTDRSIDLTNKAMVQLFENYENSLGGGIWFEPYVVDKNMKRFCFYVYRNKNNNLVIDETFSSDDYDYHNQGWYKEIISQISKDNKTAWSRPYYENQGSETMMITVGTGIFDGDKLIGISTVDWDLNSLNNDIKNIKPLEKGFYLFKTKGVIKGSFALFASSKYNYIISSNDPYLDNEALIGKTLDTLPWYNENLYYTTYFKYNGKTYVPFVRYTINDMILVINVPKSGMFKDIDKFMLFLLGFLAILGVLVPLILFASLNRYIIKPIDMLTDMAHKIGKGEEVKIKIEKPEEFAQLASTFDKMTNDIKVITKERGKIDSELSIAKSIQTSSLPNVFPPFPDRSEFDIYAQMSPAKEVGGDFYDFYFIDNDNFMFLIADVSGKGVPAALFMMTAKTLINNMAQVGYSPKELIQIINKKMCENNQQGLFVTMLSGIVNVKTGKLTMVNCGHNKPLIKRIGGNYEYLEIESNVPLGIFEDADFDIYESQLQKGDIIFTYTDGITEAMNVNDEMYGEERLAEFLNSVKDEEDVKEVISQVKQNIKQYTTNAEQSDDITMLSFKYQGLNEKTKENIKVFDDMAVIENYKPFYKWLHSVLAEWQIGKDLSNTIDMCSEELFANITFYAYPDKKGNIKVSIEKTEKEIIMQFEDSGIEYNPLKKPDPDITLPPEERPLGGLGIFMVKNMAQKVLYERNDNKNILTLIFDN